MPPKKPARQVEHERHLARRIKEEREAKGWSLEALAQHMTSAGCAMDRSAIYRLEGESRRITVDEAVTFAGVLGLPLEKMLLPPAVAASKEAARLYRRYERLAKELQGRATQLRELRDQILALVEDGHEAEVLDAMDAAGDWTGETTPFGDPGYMMAMWRAQVKEGF